ncbi:MAG: hypothetical protein AAF773_08085 [Cyanobacteria bacterium P01_D01_bin.115]
MAKTIRLKAGESAKIFHRSLSSMPMDFRFQALALDGGQPDGEIEIRGSNWIFLKSPVRQPLQEHNIVHAGFWDTFFTVSVIAHGELEITTPKRRSELALWIVWLVILVMVVAMATFLVAQ